MANTMTQIILYDTIGTKMPDKAWSPNVFKIRFALNYKQLPYRTVWVETVDVRQTAKCIGAPPTGKKRDGTLIYTVPIIFCPHCSEHVSNSLDIALHLDRAYPERLRLFTPGLTDEALVRAWDDRWNQLVGPHFITVGAGPTYAQLPPRAASFFKKTREGIFKMSLEQQMSPERIAASWIALRQGLTRMVQYTPRGRIYFAGGDAPTYPDVVMAAFLVWMKRLFGRDSSEWREIETWDEGRWARLMRAFEKWEYTEENAPAKALL